MILQRLIHFNKNLMLYYLLPTYIGHHCSTTVPTCTNPSPQYVIASWCLMNSPPDP